MCGIAGFLYFDGRPADPAPIRRMCRLLAHRGPDAESVVVDGPVALGHRRLSIIDLSAAAGQPMAGPANKTWITYNGEVYNFRELRARYEAAGASFRSHSDTEVLLHAYSETGLDFVQQLKGIFAFALWDSHTRRLVLGRDRLGAKPLYYLLEPNRLIFASEIKPILAVMDRDPAVCPEALNEYFTFQNVYSDLTLFEGIRILPAGSLLIARNAQVERRRYWDLEFAPTDTGETALASRLLETFERAVTRQLVSDVPIGSYLSGGMDSASIVAVASRHIPRLATFTVGFDVSSASDLELAFDERADSERLASRFSTEHYEMVLHAGDMAWALPRLVWHLEDLRVGNSYQNFYAARLAAKFVRVVLSGAGGDEIFAGYPWRYAPIADCWDENEFEKQYYRTWCRLLPDEQRFDFFTPAISRTVDLNGPRERFREILRPTNGWHPLDKVLYFDAKTFLHGLLIVEDKLAMAHGLEVRVPFLDEEVVALACSIPARRKFNGSTGKLILREALKPLLPEATLAKIKQGFSPPDESWYRGQSMAYVQEILLGRRALDRGYIEPAYVRRIVEEHCSGRYNHRLLIWSLLCFEWWQRLFLDGDEKSLGEAGLGLHSESIPTETSARIRI